MTPPLRGLLLTVPLAPLGAAVAVLLVGRRLRSYVGWLVVAGSVVSLGALGALLAASPGATPAASTAPAAAAIWARSGGFVVTVGLEFDALARFGALLVAIVALIVDVYAAAYMAGDEGRVRFFAGFSFFVAAMLTLVLANSLLLLFAAWEGVGLASFLLIGHWYREPEARRGAQKAFLITRLGDLGFLLAWLLVLGATGTTDIGAFLDAVQGGLAFGVPLTALALLFFAGAAGKSAQLPLTAWLPPAMAGPTPVSALIHSATMVAAGVYLVLRLYPLFAAAPAALTAILWIGGITALFAALVATVQTDVKRVLAWSTVSQLGEMMLALGLGGPLAAAYHLATHAAFKSALFLTAGIVDHATGSRDLRHLGGLGRRLPWATLAFAGAALALAGFPPFSGFWSEEAILGRAVATAPAAAGLMVFLIFLAGVYISRLGAAVFWHWPGSSAPATKRVSPWLQISTAALAVAAVALGWILSPHIARILPFAPAPEASVAWRIGVVAASLGGLALGAWRVRTKGPVAAFGPWPEALERILEAGTMAPARLSLVVARVVAGGEGVLDGAARGQGRAAIRAAQGAGDLEGAIDRAVRGVARTTVRLARWTAVSDDRGFSDGLDAAATWLGRAAARLRRLQTGRLYYYTLGLLLWVLAVAAGALAWLFLH
jgi:NADH-quinone oxidoreductase subunit L